MRNPRIELFHLSSLLQMPNNSRMIDVEFLGNFLCGCKMISFNDALIYLSISNVRPLHFSFSRFLSLLQNFLNHHWIVCSLAVPGQMCC